MRSGTTRIRQDIVLAVVGILLITLPATAAQAQVTSQTCAGLTSVPVTHMTVTAARVIEPGGLTLPSNAAPNAMNGSGQFAPPAVRDLPAFCRVVATLRPTTDSNIGIELWLPLDGWNGKLLAVGNSGWGGAIYYPGLMEGLRRGYATASTDTGHVGDTARFVVDHPEQLIDFAYRAVHEMTVSGKAVVERFYGSPARYAYFSGCSTGGGQALRAVQRFPSDYDGVLAGAPGNYWTHQLVQSLWVYRTAHRTADSYIPADKLRVLHEAVVGACDANDGLKDGLLSAPLDCTFDPGALQCVSSETAGCLTTAQVETARTIYSGVRLAATQQLVFPAAPRGSEGGWATGLAAERPAAYALEFFRYVVYKNPSWDVMSLTVERDTVAAERAAKEIVDGTNPDLRPFFARQGKLIQFHGWADPLISAQSSIDYYNAVVRAVGDRGRVDDSYRLFMAPGMNHCRGGEGPNTFDALSALEQWVEHGASPTSLLASHPTADGNVDRTRPLCPYPQVARYTGIGNPDQATNVMCRAR